MIRCKVLMGLAVKGLNLIAYHRESYGKMCVTCCGQREPSTWSGVDVRLSGVLPAVFAVSAVPATSPDVSS